ncbi:MAG: Sporulation protein YunB [Firmicutes bacterium ADurb.Bin193]|nr:MAG: Sporulation protein YunB [Firmicutes bacterium ADurb.Bin193]
MRIIAKRFGSHFGYLIRRNRIKFRILFILLIIFAVITIIIQTLKLHFIPLAFSIAEARAKGIGTIIVNEEISNQLASGAINYNELYTIQKDENGDICAITADTAKMNTVKALIITSIQNRVNDLNIQSIGIPLGNLFNNEFLAGRGPRIPIKLVTVGTIQVDFTNTFESAGINQTKHEVMLLINMQVTAIMPAGAATASIDSSVPVSQTIIVGKVPSAYANIQR